MFMYVGVFTCMYACIRGCHVVLGIILGLFFFFFYLCIFFYFSSAILTARWMELLQNRPHARKWVRCKIMFIIWGILFSYKSGAQNNPFRRLCNLTATLTASLYLQKETRHIQSDNCAENYRGSSTSSENLINFGSTNVLKLDRRFY